VRSPSQSRLWAVAAVAWLLVVVAVAAHQWQFWRGQQLNTDVLALLPVNEQAPEVTLATRALSDRAARQVVVLVGAKDWADARSAAAAWRQAVAASGAPLVLSGVPSGTDLASTLAYYRPWRDRFLTSAQRERLAAEPVASQVQSAIAALYRPGMGAKLSDWISDPLALWPDWWAARSGESRARLRDGELWVSGDDKEWVVLLCETKGSAFALSGNAVLGAALQAAADAARRVQPEVQLLAAGVPLHAEAAAVQASREVNTIGWGSLAAVLLLVWLAFRSFRPMALVAVSLAVGTATAVSVTAWVFGEVHLLTLVFGASLVGVAEDYGIHYFAMRQAQPGAQPRRLMALLLPGLVLALSTSVLAYLVLGVAPFPGLRQMALFSAVGLVAAFLTVACWFPWLDRGSIAPSRFAEAVAASLPRWPRLRAPMWVWGLVLAFTAAGCWQLRGSDDLRQLQSSPAELVRAQVDVGRLLGLPGVAQFYLVRGSSADEVLVREEVLKQRLDGLVKEGRLVGYSAVSDWVPSLARQQSNAELSARVESQVLSGVGGLLGEALRRPDFASQPLALEAWLAAPVSFAGRKLWLGDINGAKTSVVMLRGLHDVNALPLLEAAADGLPGVRWVDKVAEISSLLGRYRMAMTGLLVAGHVLVFALLWWRYRRLAWRAWLPTFLATVLTLALLGWLGQPFQLFNVLALLLLLGIGVDYGIFLLEHQGDGSAWLAVVLGAGSTWLAFGLLGLSSTPALRAFGLTLLFGIALVWVLSPCLRVSTTGVPSHASAKEQL
jgi:predicted exporter